MGGDIDKATGKVKQAAGDLTGDADLKSEGRAQETAGDVKNAGQKLGNKVKDAADGLGDKLKD
jgi:uncharacterized protein YjbJ (UPF0337 family)